jgi:flagellar biosynthesis/type III secretory pathway protein FliH
MTVLQIQQQLIQQISAINDENILTMIRQELSYHLDKKMDITDDLTPYELNELLTLANEPSDKETVTLQEYRKATERWRTKS